MGFSYFGEKGYWYNITRDERFFCSELYYKIKGNEKKFIKFLSKCDNIKIIDNEDLNAEWEISLEVCFYRDFIHEIGFDKNTHIRRSISKSNNNKPFPMKRTFDLCLFSEKKIIIIEAKAKESFDNLQLEDFKKDFHMIDELLSLSDKNVSIHLLGLWSSYYNPKKDTKKVFDNNIITWREIYSLFPNEEIFLRADNIYKHNKP